MTTDLHTAARSVVAAYYGDPGERATMDEAMARLRDAAYTSPPEQAVANDVFQKVERFMADRGVYLAGETTRALIALAAPSTSPAAAAVEPWRDLRHWKGAPHPSPSAAEQAGRWVPVTERIPEQFEDLSHWAAPSASPAEAPAEPAEAVSEYAWMEEVAQQAAGIVPPPCELKITTLPAPTLLGDDWLDEAWSIAGDLWKQNKETGRHLLFASILMEKLSGAFSCAKRAADPEKEGATCRTHCGDYTRCIATHPQPQAPATRDEDGHFCIVRLDGRAMMQGSHACSVRWGFDSTRVREYPTLANAQNSIEVCCDDDDGAAFPMQVGAWKALAERGDEWRECAEKICDMVGSKVVVGRPSELINGIGEMLGWEPGTIPSEQYQPEAGGQVEVVAAKLARQIITQHYSDEPSPESLVETAWRILQCQPEVVVNRALDLNEKARMPYEQALNLAISEYLPAQPVAPAGQAAAGVQGEAARLLALASEEYTDAAASVQHGAEQLDVPEWAQLVVRLFGQSPNPVGYPAPAVERGVADLLRAAVTLFACHCKDSTAWNWLDNAQAALSTAGKEQA